MSETIKGTHNGIPYEAYVSDEYARIDITGFVSHRVIYEAAAYHRGPLDTPDFSNEKPFVRRINEKGHLVAFIDYPKPHLRKLIDTLASEILRDIIAARPLLPLECAQESAADRVDSRDAAVKELEKKLCAAKTALHEATKDMNAKRKTLTAARSKARATR